MEEIEFHSKKERKHHIWVEKYRPSNLDEYLGNDSIKETFKKYIQQQDIPHILLYGEPGTGKTTAARCLVKQIDCDSIYINASDERTLDVVRDKIKTFASSSGFRSLKIIILDEFDGFPDLSQRSLRSIMEVFSVNTRFILTANYHERIIEPIQSRVQMFRLLPPHKKDVAMYLTSILNKENIKFSPDEMVMIINAYYPDIRKCIQTCQQSSLTGVLKVSKDAIIQYDVKNKIVELFKNKAPFLEFRKYIINQNLTRFEEIYQHLFDNLDSYANEKHGSIILNLADAIRSDSMVINKQIVFLEFVHKCLLSLKKSS